MAGIFCRSRKAAKSLYKAACAFGKRFHAADTDRFQLCIGRSHFAGIIHSCFCIALQLFLDGADLLFVLPEVFHVAFEGFPCLYRRIDFADHFLRSTCKGRKRAGARLGHDAEREAAFNFRSHFLQRGHFLTCNFGLRRHLLKVLASADFLDSCEEIFCLDRSVFDFRNQLGKALSHRFCDCFHPRRRLLQHGLEIFPRNGRAFCHFRCLLCQRLHRFARIFCRCRKAAETFHETGCATCE